MPRFPVDTTLSIHKRVCAILSIGEKEKNYPITFFITLDKAYFALSKNAYIAYSLAIVEMKIKISLINRVQRV